MCAFSQSECCVTFYVTENMMYLAVFTILSTAFVNVFCFNLDTLNPIVYEDFLSKGSGRSSYFGYSIVLDSGSPPWILIGAPRANFSHYVNVTEPGVTVRCAIAGSCTTVLLDSVGNEEPDFVGEKLPWDHKDKAWIGVSMDIEQGQHVGKTVVCGHRWKDQSFLKANKQLFMPGVCYWMESPYESASKLLPLKRPYLVEKQGVKQYQFGMGQAGSSVHLARITDNQNGSKLLIGAPGAYSWEGTNVICEDGSDFSFGRQKRAAEPNSFSNCNTIKRNTLLKGDQTFPYIGYSVSSGKFFDCPELLFVSSAPRSYLKGAVIIFKSFSSSQQQIIDTLRGETVTEYFGASITVCDVNGDGLDELIVGAPFFSVNKDEGRIYVFTRSNSMKSMKLYQKIDGQNSGGQFGLAVTSLGQLNRDECDDVAVGAPYEDNGRGAVYIYNGGYESLKLSQKITASLIYPHLRGFGISLSNAADIDSNGIKDVAVGSYLSGHAVILRASPVVILKAEIFSTTYLIQRTTKTFVVHPAIKCTGCEDAHIFSVNLKLKVDTKYDQAFVDKQMSSHEFNQKLQFAGHSSKNTYVDIFIKEDPDTLKDIELNLLIEMENKTGNTIVIRKDKREGEDAFCKNCTVVDESQSQLKDTKIVKFVNACGKDEKCDACLQMACSVKNPRFGGNNVYIVGSEGLISLEVMLHNGCEPAYSVTLTVESEALIEPAKIPKLCKQTIDLEIVCDIGNVYNDTIVAKNLTVEFDVMSVTKYAFINENATMLTFSIIVNTTSNDINNTTQCSTVVQLEREANIKISGLSKPDYLLLKDSDQHVRHLYKAVKEGPTPVKEVHFTIDVPTHYIADNGKSVEFLRIQPVQFYQNGKEVLCRQPDQEKVMRNTVQKVPVRDQTILVRVKKSTTLQEEHTLNKNMNTASENKTLFLNCSSSNVRCQKVICSASEMWNQNAYFDVPVDLVFNASSLKPLMGAKSTVLFSTTANAELSLSKDMLVMSGRKSVSTVIVADKPYESVAVWIIILAIIGGILLLCLLIFGMKKAGFFRRKKKELLLQGSLQKEAVGETANE
ncbi:integrin alpha-PS5-like isoform X1 [Schistocerca gregaria]|uniref:integrin alpha-PS5-like isoform X1 n=1 Tax=Schistocerca gregaria TaxID=7010 RepID=UPI00211E1447|nr:integrin alpha-PS5-like isoform X1 [Schistocerca gregaria]